MITAGRLLGRALRVGGVDAVYGHPLPDAGVVPVRDGAAAALVALAHRRVHGTPAAVSEASGRIRVGAPGVGGPGVDGLGVAGPARTISCAGDLLDAVPDISRGAVTLLIDLDLGSPAPDVFPAPPPPPERRSDADDEWIRLLASADDPLVLAGPGVVHDRAVPGLNALAAAGSLGVLNTWGAKGVFDWRSRHHLATVGLQALDFELGGIRSADLVVATGIDAAEAPPERWQTGRWVALPPAALGTVAERWSRPFCDIPVPPLRAGLAAVTQEGWGVGGAPLAPTRATLHYAQILGRDGLVAADPGVCGYWVARTFSTTTLGSAQVPAAPACRGFAAACALVARLRSPGRPVLATVDAPLADGVTAVLEAAASLGVGIPVEVWDGDALPVDADTHAARLVRLVFGDDPAPAPLATDPRQLDRMVDVAGPVIAWGGIAAR